MTKLFKTILVRSAHGIFYEVEVPSAADGASGGNIAFLSGGKRYAIIVAGATAAFREVRTGGAKYPVGDGNSAKKISIA